jgi:deoxyadenosine/deoxycytidine kinase
MNSLIIVEGLTGSGKSTMAHFIARQLWYQGVDADWVHEGECPHPVLADVDDDDIENYMQGMLPRWKSYVAEIQASGRVSIVEACFLNNLIETLFIHNVDRNRIVQYASELETVMQALNPALVYLVQPNVPQALERNFRNRGKGFEDYVVQFATGTPYAKIRQFKGYEGMVCFWQDFVGLTDDIYRRLHMSKVWIDNSSQQWDRQNHQVMSFLSSPIKPDPRTSERQAAKYLGTYKPENGKKTYAIEWEPEHLSVNLFLDVKTTLIHKTGNVFYARGWPFDICFVESTPGKVDSFSIRGKTVDYLPVTGIVATRQAQGKDQSLT